MNEVNLPPFFEEVIGYEEFEARKTKHSELQGYVGIEPSGELHLGYVLLFRAINWLNSQGVKMKILLADLHALMNQKGNIENIRQNARRMKEEFQRWNVQADFLDGSDMISSDYFVQLAGLTDHLSLARFRRTLTIQGREEDYLNEHPISLLYAMMQLTDIFALKVDVCLSGMDQRRIHVLAREVAARFKLPSPSLFHLRLLTDLKSEGKMSKSHPESAIFLDESEESIKKKIRKAFLAPRTSSSTLFDIVEVILPDGSCQYEERRLNAQALRQKNLEGTLDPVIFKNHLASELAQFLHQHDL